VDYEIWNKQQMAIKSIKLNTAAPRVAVLVLAVLCLIFTYVSAKWFFANTIAARSVNKVVAEFSIGLAPSDPQAHFSSAVFHEKTFLPEDLPKSLAEFEQAVALSPYDYRLWYELGRARERGGGDAAGAEKALRRALELAPNYSQVQWALGNSLLRQGSETEAFVYIRKAADSDKTFAGPAIASVWQLFQGDTARIKNYIGDSVNLKAAFALLLAKEKRVDETLDIWMSLPETARRTDFKAQGDEIYQKMLEDKKYRTAIRIFSDISDADEKKFVLGRMTNGGFETNINPQNPGVFDWQIGDGVEPQILIDKAQKRGGEISLVIVFNNKDGKAYRNLSQTVAVEANKRYVFETFYKSDLDTKAALKWEIVDATDANKVLAATEMIAPKADWTSLKTEFVAPGATEAVIVRLSRPTCPVTLCPISGKLWFDDFSLN
jgi:tetratricopeptide (TPR) repeat protein